MNHFPDNPLNPLFKLPPVFRAGHHTGQIQGHHTFLGHRVRHKAHFNPLSQTFHNGSFPHAWFPDKAGIVFSSSAQYLNHSLNFIISPDYRVQSVFRCQFCQISGILVQHRGACGIFPPVWLSILKFIFVLSRIFSHGHQKVCKQLLKIYPNGIHKSGSSTFTLFYNGN